MRKKKGEKIKEIPKAVKSSVRDYATEFNMYLFESFLHIFTEDGAINMKGKVKNRSKQMQPV